MQAGLVTAEAAQAAEHEVRHGGLSARNAVIFHERAQQVGVALLFVDKQRGDASELRGVVFLGEALRGAQQRGAFGLLAELEDGDGACDQPALLVFQNVRQSCWNAAGMLRMVFKMIQPDFQIAEHFGGTSYPSPWIRVTGD